MPNYHHFMKTFVMNKFKLDKNTVLMVRGGSITLFKQSLYRGLDEKQ